MSYITDHRQKFQDLRIYLDNQEQLRRQANGGNSIMFSYPPDEEIQYINKAKEIYADDAAFIDVSKLLVQFIDDEGWDSFSKYYNDFINTPHVIFYSKDPKPDLFASIIREIYKASRIGKIPFLIRTGALYGTGIENNNIMVDKTIMSLTQPLVIFYPSKFEGGNIYFLNFKLASKYRCVLVK